MAKVMSRITKISCQTFIFQSAPSTPLGTVADALRLIRKLNKALAKFVTLAAVYGVLRLLQTEKSTVGRGDYCIRTRSPKSKGITVAPMQYCRQNWITDLIPYIYRHADRVRGTLRVTSEGTVADLSCSSAFDVLHSPRFRGVFTKFVDAYVTARAYGALEALPFTSE